MSMIDRVKNILLSPKTEWPTIAGETTTPQALYTGYIMILAAIAPVAMLISSAGAGIGRMIFSYVIALVFTAVIAWVLDQLAPSFGGKRDFVQALKLIAYASTAAWIAGIFDLLGTIGALVGLLAACYSLYTFYLGAPAMGKCAPEKAVGFTVVVVLCAIVAGVAIGVLMAMLGFRSALM